jgi:hypothetical protein
VADHRHSAVAADPSQLRNPGRHQPQAHRHAGRRRSTADTSRENQSPPLRHRRPPDPHPASTHRSRSVTPSLGEDHRPAGSRCRSLGQI